jgi:hypothetical protein
MSFINNLTFFCSSILILSFKAQVTRPKIESFFTKITFFGTKILMQVAEN